MRAILGRLSDLGLGELFKLLSSAGAEGTLEIEAPGGRLSLLFSRGYVAGEATAVLALALATRSGTFCFRPGDTPADSDWVPREEFLARVASLQTESGVGAGAQAAVGANAAAVSDPLSELRDSLAEIPLRFETVRILVATGDPRPYRALEPQWRQRGWDVEVQSGPAWPETVQPSLVIVHLPSSGTFAGQSEAWYGLARRADQARPRIPVLWVGGVADSGIRHQAILAGADFLIPAPIAEIGETARWFREEMTVLADRLLARRSQEVQSEAEAFREFFVALHAEASPSEVRASLLRLASSFFRRGALFAVCDHAFESLGAFGLPVTVAGRLSRANTRLEAAVVERGPQELGGVVDADSVAVARALGLEGFDDAVVLPLIAGGECTALFIGDGKLDPASSMAGLAALFARSGSMLAL